MFTLNEKTPNRVATLLNNLNMSKQRVRIVYGDVNTGKDWLEENDVIGTIGKSTGDKPIPLLIHNARSFGGGGILDHCILKIVDVKSKRTLYQHVNYIEPSFSINESKEDGYTSSVSADGKIQANFKSHKEALNYIDFMLCKRMKK